VNGDTETFRPEGPPGSLSGQRQRPIDRLLLFNSHIYLMESKAHSDSDSECQEEMIQFVHNVLPLFNGRCGSEPVARCPKFLAACSSGK
jgi:hypothetical protein